MAKGAKNIHINVLLNTEITDEILEDLCTYGKVIGKLEQIDALTMKVSEDLLAEIQALPYVEAANPDAERKGSPVDTVEVQDFTDGLSTWNLDVVNVTNPFLVREVDYDGEGVYIAVLDTGLLGTWRQYFPEERIAEEYAISFGGGGNDRGKISTQPTNGKRIPIPMGLMSPAQ